MAHPGDRAVQLIERTLSEFDTEVSLTHRPFQHTLLLRFALWTRKEIVYRGGNIGYVASVRIQMGVLVYRGGSVMFERKRGKEKKANASRSKDSLRGYLWDLFQYTATTQRSSVLL